MPGHLPVLLDEVLLHLQPHPDGHYLDATFGGGGHTRALLDHARGCRVTALDCDPEAAARASALALEFPHHFHFHDLNFRDLATLAETGFDGILLDLGVSSFQLDTPARGFSFRAGGPSDMRLDPRAGRSAALFLETAERQELVRAIRDFGEETQWRRVVDAILHARGSGLLSDTASLAELISRHTSRRPGARQSIHPATLSFQGIRMLVNGELEALETVLPVAFDKLQTGGRLAVISFHSLEDRIVKRFFRRMAGLPEHENDSQPAQSRVVQARLIARKPITPGEEELRRNPRARSARLRILEKELAR